MTDNALRNGDKRFSISSSWGMLVQREHMSNLAQIKSGVFSMNVYIINCQEHMSNVAQIASPGSGVFSMKVYKSCSVLDVRLLFLRDWSFKSECECDLWRPPLPETIGLPTGRVLCISVIVKNYGIIGDFCQN